MSNFKRKVNIVESTTPPTNQYDWWYDLNTRTLKRPSGGGFEIVGEAGGGSSDTPDTPTISGLSHLCAPDNELHIYAYGNYSDEAQDYAPVHWQYKGANGITTEHKIITNEALPWSGIGLTILRSASEVNWESVLEMMQLKEGPDGQSQLYSDVQIFIVFPKNVTEVCPTRLELFASNMDNGWMSMLHDTIKCGMVLPVSLDLLSYDEYMDGTIGMPQISQVYFTSAIPPSRVESDPFFSETMGTDLNCVVPAGCIQAYTDMPNSPSTAVWHEGPQELSTLNLLTNFFEEPEGE